MMANDTYDVHAQVWLDTSVPVSAGSLDEAVQRAKNMKIQDFVRIKGNHNDSKVKVVGVIQEMKEIDL
jgi:hypothetical protein